MVSSRGWLIVVIIYTKLWRLYHIVRYYSFVCLYLKPGTAKITGQRIFSRTILLSDQPSLTTSCTGFVYQQRMDLRACSKFWHLISILKWLKSPTKYKCNNLALLNTCQVQITIKSCSNCIWHRKEYHLYYGPWLYYISYRLLLLKFPVIY